MRVELGRLAREGWRPGRPSASGAMRRRGLPTLARSVRFAERRWGKTCARGLPCRGVLPHTGRELRLRRRKICGRKRVRVRAMSDINKISAQMRAAAEKATQELWVSDAEACVGVVYPQGGKATICTAPLGLWSGVCGVANCAHIVAAQPRNVLAILDELGHLRAALSAIHGDGKALFSAHQVRLFQQWYNAVQDLNPAYLEKADHNAAKALSAMIQAGKIK